MYSRMTGVAKEYQSKGIGYLIKRKQREISLKRGFPFIAWNLRPDHRPERLLQLQEARGHSPDYPPDYYGPHEGLDKRRICAGEWLILRTSKVIRHSRVPWTYQFTPPPHSYAAAEPAVTNEDRANPSSLPGITKQPPCTSAPWSKSERNGNWPPTWLKSLSQRKKYSPERLMPRYLTAASIVQRLTPVETSSTPAPARPGGTAACRPRAARSCPRGSPARPARSPGSARARRPGWCRSAELSRW